MSRARAPIDAALPGRPIAGEKHPDSFYKTPVWVTEALLDREEFPAVVWEPACGNGMISSVLKRRGVPVVSSDLHDRGYGVTGADFLDPTVLCAVAPGGVVRSIVTNPPFHASLPEKFLHRALAIPSVEKVALLMRTLWLEGAGRGRRVFGGATPLARVHVLSDRANVSRDGYAGPPDGRGGTVSFSWFVWERGYVGDPVLKWIT